MDESVDQLTAAVVNMDGVWVLRVWSGPDRLVSEQPTEWNGADGFQAKGLDFVTRLLPSGYRAKEWHKTPDGAYTAVLSRADQTA